VYRNPQACEVGVRRPLFDQDDFASVVEAEILRAKRRFGTVVEP
jgi:hypothetical protein